MATPKNESSKSDKKDKVANEPATGAPTQADPAAEKPPAESAAAAPVLTEAQKKAAEDKLAREAHAQASAAVDVEGVTIANSVEELVDRQSATTVETDDGTEGPTPLRKLNPKDIMGGEIKSMVMSGKLKLPCDLFLIYGNAANLRDGESSFGPWTALVGEFKAIRVSDNQEFIANEAHIPGAAGDILVKAVRGFVTEEISVTSEEFKKNGKTYKVTGETVELALLVGAVESKRAGGAPYEFVVKPIVRVKTQNTLGPLESRAQKFLEKRKLALLAAPKDDVRAATG